MYKLVNNYLDKVEGGHAITDNSKIILPYSNLLSALQHWPWETASTSSNDDLVGILKHRHGYPAHPEFHRGAQRWWTESSMFSMLTMSFYPNWQIPSHLSVCNPLWLPRVLAIHSVLSPYWSKSFQPLPPPCSHARG